MGFDQELSYYRRQKNTLIGAFADNSKNSVY